MKKDGDSWNTNRMGLEKEDDYGLSAHLEVLEAMIEPGDTENQQLICLLLELKRRRATAALDEAERAELLAYRKASKEPVADVVAWNKPGEERKCDIRLRRFDVAPGPLFAAPPLQAVTVLDDMRNRLKAEGIAELLRDALGYAPLTTKQWEVLANNWHQTFVGLSGDATLKSVTNEP